MKRLQYRTSRLDWRTAVISLTAAILTLAATAIPLFSTVADREGTIADKDAQIAHLTEELDSVTATANERAERIEELRSDNRELKAALPYTVDPEDAHDVRKVATVTLAKRGDTLDLNSTAPNFAGDGYQWVDTVSYNGTALRLAASIDTVRLREGVATYETCAATTGWAQQESLDPHLLQEPTTCLRLASGRYATIQTPRHDHTSADLVITVWE